MSKNIKTHLYCFDEHRSFTEDIRKKFDDVSKYAVLSFQAQDEYLKKLSDEKESKFCKIAIIGLHDATEQYEMFDHLTIDIKKIDRKTGIILLCPPDRIEDVRKTIKFNIDAYIPQNANSILRIHNTVKKLKSEHNIVIFTKRRNLSLIVLLAFVIFSALAVLIAYLKLPKFF